jgi:hypothetical protein
MSYYRLYFMSSYFGHIERFEDFDALDDGAAVALAKSRQGPLALELWTGHRKVKSIEAHDLASQLIAQRSEIKAVKAQVEPSANLEDNEKAENRSG